MLVKHFNRAGKLVTTEVPDDKVEPSGKVGDPHNLEYNRIWSEYFPAEAELVKVRGYYGDPWFRDWRYVGPSPAPYTMMAVKVRSMRDKTIEDLEKLAAYGSNTASQLTDQIDNLPPEQKESDACLVIKKLPTFLEEMRLKKGKG